LGAMNFQSFFFDKIFFFSPLGLCSPPRIRSPFSAHCASCFMCQSGSKFRYPSFFVSFKEVPFFLARFLFSWEDVGLRFFYSCPEPAVSLLLPPLNLPCRGKFCSDLRFLFFSYSVPLQTLLAGFFLVRASFFFLFTSPALAMRVTQKSFLLSLFFPSQRCPVLQRFLVCRYNCDHPFSSFSILRVC